jgi:hypothetical protein
MGFAPASEAGLLEMFLHQDAEAGEWIFLNEKIKAFYQ